MPIPTPTPRQAAEELARRSLSDFARTMIPSLDLTPFHRSYYDTLDRFARGEIRRLIVSIPPQHGKSLGSSVLLPAYLLGRQPDRRIALASYNLRLASRFNRQIQRLMDASAYRSVFPRTRLKRSSAKDRGTLRTAEEFELVGSRGGLLSVGRDGALTGRPVDVFILDDLYKNAQEANSPIVRDHAWDWYNAVVKTRLHNDSQELLVFTRWHEDDLIGRIAAREPVADISENGQRSTETASSWFRLNFEAVKQGPPTSADPRRQNEPL
ncbi:MAG: terminase large subunit domain-containing protein [Alistipes sp.]